MRLKDIDPVSCYAQLHLKRHRDAYEITTKPTSVHCGKSNAMPYASVLKFGVHSFVDDEGRQVGSDESFRAHRYYNALMEVKLAERKRYREIRSAHVPELDGAERRMVEIGIGIDAIYDAVSKERQRVSAPSSPGGKATPTKVQMSAEQKAALDSLVGERKLVSEQLKSLRREFEDAIKPARRAFDERTSGASAQLLQQIEEIGKQLKAAKGERGNPDVAKLARSLDELKKRKKAGSPATHKKGQANASVWAQMEAEEWPAVWKELKRLEVETQAACRKLRSDSGLFHGTYAAVEAAVDQAFETADGDPGFRSWNGGRKIGVQLSGKREFSAINSGGNAVLRIEEQDMARVRTDGNPTRYVIASMRLGTQPEKWVRVRVKIHRAIPENAEVLWAYLVPRMIGERLTWSFQMTIKTEEPLIQRSFGSGTATVQLRWSMSVDGQPHGILVAEVNGEPVVMTGRTELDREPADHSLRGHTTYGGLLRVRYLRGVSDLLFEGSAEDPERGARTKLITWMAEHPELVPAWMVEETGARAADEHGRARRGIAQWRRHQPLAKVAARWIGEALTPERVIELWNEWRSDRDKIAALFGPERGDYHVDDRRVLDEWLEKRGVTDEGTRMCVWLEWWRRKDAHLRQWASDLERKSRGARKNQYRYVASRLARSFGEVVVIDSKLAEVAKRKKIGQDETHENQQARYQRQCAAPSEFIEALQGAFGKARFSKRERSGDEKKAAGARKTVVHAANAAQIEGHVAAE